MVNIQISDNINWVIKWVGMRKLSRTLVWILITVPIFVFNDVLSLITVCYCLKPINPYFDNKQKQAQICEFLQLNLLRHRKRSVLNQSSYQHFIQNHNTNFYQYIHFGLLWFLFQKLGDIKYINYSNEILGFLPL